MVENQRIEIAAYQQALNNLHCKIWTLKNTEKVYKKPCDSEIRNRVLGHPGRCMYKLYKKAYKNCICLQSELCRNQFKSNDFLFIYLLNIMQQSNN